MAKSVTFIDQIAANKRNSNILMLSMVLLLVALGSVFGGFYGDWQTGAFAGVIAAVICLVIALCGGADCLLAFSGAAELHREEVAGVLELQTLFNVVEEMSIAAGVPMPRVFLIDEAAPNAFATGASPENSAVAVTTGLLAKLNSESAPPRNAAFGLTIYMFSVTRLSRIGVRSPLRISRASASPSGLRVNCTAEASARYSR